MVRVLWAAIISGAVFTALGLVMVVPPDRDTPYGTRRRSFGVIFCVLGPFVAILGLFGVPFGR